MVYDGSMEWQYGLPHIQHVCNNSINASTSKAPSELCYDFLPREVAYLKGKAIGDITKDR